MHRAYGIFFVATVMLFAAHVLAKHIGTVAANESGAVALLAIGGVAFMACGGLVAVLESKG